MSNAGTRSDAHALAATGTARRDAPRDAARANADAAGQAAGALLRATAIQKRYRMGAGWLEVLQNCDLAIGDGEFLAIMGKSGSGKSTLLHILGALDVPQDGQVVFDGQPLFAPPGRRKLRTSAIDVFSADERRRIALRRRVFGFVFQFYHLLPELNVLENVLLPCMVDSTLFGWWGRRRAARAAASAILERVGLGARLRHRPSQLSGGERQRVAVARALVHQPRLLLADEPTGNLDAESGAQLMDLLAGLHRDGQTIVMVTHDPSVARYADRVVLLEKGRIALPPDGPPASA
ncbi:MAG: ABC transporter ATP-binding protein [Phycisphaerae bacterium]